MIFFNSGDSKGQNNRLDKKTLEIFHDLQDEYFRTLVSEFNYFLQISPNYKAMEDLKLKEFPQEVTWAGRYIFRKEIYNNSKILRPQGVSLNFERELMKQEMIEVWNEVGMRVHRISKIIGMIFNIEAKELQHKLAQAYIHCQDKKHSEALSIFNELLMEGSKLDKYTTSVIANNIGCLKFYLYKEKGIISNFTAALLLNKDSKIYYNLACAYTWSEKWDRAKVNFTKANIFNSKRILDFLESESAIVNVEPALDKVELAQPVIELVEENNRHPKKPESDKRGIANVYVGIPKNISEEIIWVQDKFRTNPLSFIPGGTTVVVEYHSGEVLGYDKIKRPSDYIGKFFESSNSKTSYGYNKMNELDKINFYKQRINRIFARKKKDGHIFEEVWNCEWAQQLPWKSLVKFDFSVKNSFKHKMMPNS